MCIKHYSSFEYFLLLFSVCKYLVVELQDRLDETGKSKEVIRTGHGLDQSKKKAIDYRKS